MALADTILAILIIIMAGFWLVSRFLKKPITEVAQDLIDKLNPIEEVKETEKII